MDIPHIGFILAAYGITAAIVAATVAAVLLDGRALRRALRDLDAPRRGGGPSR